MKSLLVGLCILCLVVLAAGKNAGFKTRITQKGLDYANNAAIQALKKNVATATIPNQSGKIGKFKYEIKNIRVTGFNPPKSSISMVTGRGLKWTASGAYITVHGDFSYKALFIKDSGSFDAKVSGVNFQLGINIGEDTSGRPNISAQQCSSSVGDVDFKFHGGMAWLYNLFREKVGKMIKDQLNDQMCKIIKKEVNEDGEKKLSEIKVTTTLGKKFLLDYRLSQAPTFTTSYMETYHKGEIYWLDDPKKECPLPPPQMPDPQDSQSMMYLWVSDYMFNSASYVAQEHGFLVYNLTAKDLPPSGRAVLNTSCSGFIPKCVGSLIPEIGKKYPNSVVDLRMTSTRAPTLKVTPSGLTVKCAGDINMYADVPGQKTPPFLITLGAVMSTTVNVSIKNELIYAEVGDLSVKLKAGRSAIGPVSDTFLDFLVKSALKIFLIPKLNGLGQKGFPLPMTKEIKFVNTKLTFLQDTIMIGTDLNYKPSAAEEYSRPDDVMDIDRKSDNHGDDTLRFKPSADLHLHLNI